MSSHANLSDIGVRVGAATFRFASPFQVRLSGFSIDHLLATSQSSAAERERTLTAERDDLLATLVSLVEGLTADDVDDRRKLERNKRKVVRYVDGHATAFPRTALEAMVAEGSARTKLDALLERVQRIETQEEEARAHFDERLERARDDLRSTYTNNEALQDAVFQQSRSAYRGLASLLAAPESRDKRSRQRERMAMLYLQRFCAKNDTNSLFGPLGFGFFDEPGASTSFRVRPGTERRHASMAYWASHHLLASNGGMSHRLNPSLTLEGERVAWWVASHDATEWFRRKYLQTSASEELLEVLAVFRESSEAATVRSQLERRLGFDDEEIAETIEQLLEIGILLERGLPVGTLDPLRVAGGRTKSEFDDFERLIAAYPNADASKRRVLAEDLETRFEAVTSESAERGQGKHYVDRMLLHEDGSVGVDVTFDRTTIERTLRAVSVLLSVSALPIDLVRENVREWFRGTFPSGALLPALDVHRRFDEDGANTIDADSSRARDIRQAIEEVRRTIEEAPSEDGVAVVDRVRLERAAAHADARPSYASADLLFARRGDTFTSVLGEAHAMFVFPTNRLRVAEPEDRARILESLRALLKRLAGGRLTAEPLFLHTQATDRREPITDLDLRMIGDAERPEVDDFGRLRVGLFDGRFRFMLEDREVLPIATYRPHPFFQYTCDLAPLLDDFADKFFPTGLLPDRYVDGAAPRLTLDGLVFRRRTWTVSSTVFGSLVTKDAWASYIGAQNLRRSLSCPRYVFVSVPGEPKPVFLDFDNFLLIDTVARLGKKAEPGTPVRLQEMLPAPDELCMAARDGPRTFELRTGLYRCFESRQTVI